MICSFIINTYTQSLLLGSFVKLFRFKTYQIEATIEIPMVYEFLVHIEL